MNQKFFVTNRQNLINNLQDADYVILTAFRPMQRGIDSAYKLEQEPNFWYLTGVTHADWRLVIDIKNKAEHLIKPDLSETQQIFDGSLSDKEAKKISGVKSVLNFKDGAEILNKIIKNKSVVYMLNTPKDLYGFCLNPAQQQLRKDLRGAKIKSLDAHLIKMRAIKQKPEIEAIKKAVDITCQAFTSLSGLLADIKTEYEAEAVLSYVFKKNNADHAYDPIVASDDNACTLHYIDNNASLKNKKWLLIDAGARYQNYAGDITRTLPLKKPTKRHEAIYNAVRNVHDFALSLCVPDQPLAEFGAKIDAKMQQELKKLGLYKKTSDYRRYFPHAIGHGLGLDVHDRIGQPALKPGMVLTIEPGIYIPDEHIGVRIENDILITNEGATNLSSALNY